MTVLGPNDPRAFYRPENWAWWCKIHFRSMAEGGVWAVPRSALVFQKRGDKLVLILRLPVSEIMEEIAKEGKEVSYDEAEVLRIQDEDFEAIREQFALAGIEVTREV